MALIDMACMKLFRFPTTFQGLVNTTKRDSKGNQLEGWMESTETE